jgi:DNA-binding response OmpR family regulator
MRLLVVEDEIKVARFIERGLREEGFTVETAPDGESGLIKARSGQFDLIILDVMLPERDGFSVLRELRASAMSTRVLMLTARDGVSDRVQGLDLGADDYLVKPFAFAELLARVRALLRRSRAIQVCVSLLVRRRRREWQRRQRRSWRRNDGAARRRRRRGCVRFDCAGLRI